MAPKVLHLLFCLCREQNVFTLRIYMALINLLAPSSFTNSQQHQTSRLAGGSDPPRRQDRSTKVHIRNVLEGLRPNCFWGYTWKAPDLTSKQITLRCAEFLTSPMFLESSVLAPVFIRFWIWYCALKIHQTPHCRRAFPTSDRLVRCNLLERQFTRTHDSARGKCNRGGLKWEKQPLVDAGL